MKKVTCKKCKKKNIIEDVEKWNKNYMKCSFCQELYCPLPKTERRLMQWQDLYLINRSEYMARLLHDELVPYVKSIILKDYISKIKVDKIEYYINNTITLLFFKYLQNKHFKIRDSFYGYLYHKVNEAIFGKPEREVGVVYKIQKNKNIKSIKPSKMNIKKMSIDWTSEETQMKEVLPSNSLNYFLADGTEIEIEDSRNIIDEIDLIRDKFYLRKNLVDLITISYSECKTPKEKWFRLLSLSLYFNKGEIKGDKIFQKFKRVGKEKYEDIIELIKDFLKESDIC